MEQNDIANRDCDCRKPHRTPLASLQTILHRVATHACALWQDNCACAKADAEEMDAEGEEMKRSASPGVGESETQIPSGGKYENNAKEEAAESPRSSELEKTALTEKMLADETVITGSSPSPPPQTKEGGKKESAGHDSSKQLAGSSKLEDQINLQHLVELMQIFYVSSCPEAEVNTAHCVLRHS